MLAEHLFSLVPSRDTAADAIGAACVLNSGFSPASAAAQRRARKKHTFCKYMLMFADQLRTTPDALGAEVRTRPVTCGRGPDAMELADTPAKPSRPGSCWNRSDRLNSNCRTRWLRQLGRVRRFGALSVRGEALWAAANRERTHAASLCRPTVRPRTSDAELRAPSTAAASRETDCWLADRKSTISSAPWHKRPADRGAERGGPTTSERRASQRRPDAPRPRRDRDAADDLLSLQTPACGDL